MTKKIVNKITLSGFFLRLFLLLSFLLFGYGLLLVFNLNKNINKIIPSDNPPNTNSITNITTLIKSSINQNKKKLKGAKNDRINILLLGIGGVNHKGQYLTDTIALVSINPKTYQSAILSIPRDLYVQIPNSTYHTKINALYTYGLRNKKLSSKESASLIIESVEKITNEDIPYYIILDFQGFKEIIQLLNGINIEVENDIYDNHYPGPNYSYQTFKIKKGFHHLDAETALKYARVRHTKGGDFGRAHRQQQIIASAREKALSLDFLSNPNKILKFMNILGDHLKTNIAIDEIPSMISLIKNINIHQTTTKVLDAWDKDSLLQSTHIPLGGVSAYILIPKIKNYSQIHNLSKNIFNIKKLKELQNKISNEKAKILFLTPDYNTFKMFKKTLFKWNYQITNTYNKNFYSQYCTKNKDSIFSYDTKEKIFTLNDLAEKLDLKVNYLSKDNTKMANQSTRGKNLYDIILCISNATAQYFNAENTNTPNTFINSQEILTEDGKVLINEDAILHNDISF